jgi:hypothetical protein
MQRLLLPKCFKNILVLYVPIVSYSIQCAVLATAARSNMRSPATAACAAVLLALILLGSSTAEARLTNVVTDWVNATQAVVATDGFMNQLAAR